MDEVNYKLVMLAVSELKAANASMSAAVGAQGTAIEKLADTLTLVFQDAALSAATQNKIIDRLKKLEEEVAKLRPAS